MARPVTIGFAGTDARTLLSAVAVSQTGRNQDTCFHRGAVVRGTPAMPVLAAEVMNWDIDFIDTKDNTAQGYADALAAAFETRALDYAVPMPETLLFNGIVDRLEARGFGNRIAGLRHEAAFIEGDKILCKELCRRTGIPVADAWEVADARSFFSVAGLVLDYLHDHGGAVIKFPYSAGGKGARIVLDAWQIPQVWEGLMADYRKIYKKRFGNRPWPLLIESRMTGAEISFTILVDGNGGFQVLPTAMDYPERFEGPATSENPITGGMGSISPHPMESDLLMEMVRELVAFPLVNELRAMGQLRPCILYPGCFVSFETDGRGLVPSAIRVCEINIRPGEPEFQAVMRRIRNPGPLFEAMFTGELGRVAPDIRDDQICLTTALVTGPGGPDGQKGYPWRVTRNEPVEIDFKYLRKKGLMVVPSAMGISEEKGLISDGTRVAYLVCNAKADPAKGPAPAAEKLMNKVKTAFEGGRIRLVPREDPQGNRFAFRPDIGSHYRLAGTLAGTLPEH